MMTCQECVEKLHLFLDRELSPDEQADVERHLTQCGHCADSFRFEEGVLRAVAHSCRSTVASEALKTRVRLVVQTITIERKA